MSVIEEAKAIWKRIHSANGGTSVSAVAWVGKDGEFDSYLNGPCHAVLTTPMYYARTETKKPEIGKVISVFSGIQKNKTTLEDKPEVERTFIEWLLFHSPFKTAFLPTTTADALDHRVLMGDAENAPSNLMGGGLMATRIFNEHPSVLTMWWELVKAGIHPSVAFIFSHRIYVDDSGFVYSHRPSHNGCLDSHLGGGWSDANIDSQKSYVLNFLQNKPVGASKGNYNKAYKDSIYSYKLWSGANKEADNIPAPTNIHTLVAKAANGGNVSKNPFGKAKPATGQAKLENVLEEIVPFLNRYKEFF